jgi:Mycobacterium membrane protein
MGMSGAFAAGPPRPGIFLNMRLLAGAAVVGAVGIAFGLVWVASDMGFQLDQDRGKEKMIRYEVTDDSATADNVTYMIDHGERQETKVTLPWSKEFTAAEGFQAFVVNAQNSGPGSITCKILVDGKVVNQQTSNGQYALVVCSAAITS